MQIVLAGGGVEEIALLLDRCKFGVALIRDQVKQRVANTLIGNLQNRLPFRTAGIVAELDHVGRHGAKLHLEFVVAEFRGVETDVLLPLPEVIGPVIKCSNLRHNVL